MCKTVTNAEVRPNCPRNAPIGGQIAIMIRVARIRIHEQRILMSGRPALIRQRDCKQIIAAAKKAGVPRVEMKIGQLAVILHLNAPEEKSDASNANEWLADDSDSA